VASDSTAQNAWTADTHSMMTCWLADKQQLIDV